jgi:hypothetical protein
MRARRPRLRGCWCAQSVLSRSFAADAENQRGSSPISGTSRAAGGPSTVLGHHPLTKPKPMKVTPINNITSGHHRLIIPLKSDMATDPLLPVIGRCCRQLDVADRFSGRGQVLRQSTELSEGAHGVGMWLCAVRRAVRP